MFKFIRKLLQKSKKQKYYKAALLVVRKFVEYQIKQKPQTIGYIAKYYIDCKTFSDYVWLGNEIYNVIDKYKLWKTPHIYPYNYFYYQKVSFIHNFLNECNIFCISFKPIVKELHKIIED